MRRDLGVALPHGPHHVQVVIEWQIWVNTSLHQDRGGTKLCCAADHVQHLFDVDRIGFFVSWRAVKRTKSAIHVADIGVVRIGVDDESHQRLGVESPSDDHRQLTQVEEWRLA